MGINAEYMGIYYRTLNTTGEVVFIKI